MTLEGPGMYAKGKGSSAPSDAQAREKLALYVYEYLLHVGAQKAAQTFLNEIRWEKNITLGEPPGFLHSWWCVFWDLYCAAPERRETCDHSSEAKAFHDYGFVNSGYSVNGIPHHPRQPMLSSGMDPTRPPGPPSMGPRMTPPRGPGPMGPGGPIGPYGPMRGPPPPGPMPPMGGPGGRPPWPPSSAPGMSPVYGGGPPGGGPPGPGSSTPIMPSPQDSNTSSGDNMYPMMKPTSAMSGDMCNPPDGNMGPMSGPGGPGPGSGPPGGPGGPGGNGGGNGGPGNSGPGPGPDGGGPGNISGNGNINNGEPNMNTMKSSPANGPGTPREDMGMGGMGDMGGYGNNGENDQNESAAILKIKESMQEEAKRFEKDGDHPDYFMQ